MALNFSRFFETYTNHYSFVNLLNLCKEVADYVYNHDVIKSEFFDEFKETSKGYEILFNRSGKKNYFIDAKKETVKDEKGDDQFIDSVYEEVENLYDIIKNYEIMVNIKQIDEEVKTFNQLFEEKLANDVYDLKSSILDEYKKKFDYGKYKKLIDEDINSLINVIDRNYNNKPSKEQLKIEIERSMKDLKLKESAMNEGIKELENKIGNEYVSLKRGILDLIDKKFNGDETKVKNFMKTYVDPNSEEILEGLIEDADLLDFYFKMQSDVDQILLDNNYYDDPPEVESLYDYVIDGTFDAVVYCMEEMIKELFEE